MDLLTLVLASKLSIILFLLSLLILAIGIICLVWKRISDCIRKFGTEIRGTQMLYGQVQLQRKEEKEVDLANSDNRDRNGK